MFTSGPVSSEIAVVSFGMFMGKASHTTLNVEGTPQVIAKIASLGVPRCESRDLTHQTVSDRILSDVLRAAFLPA